jgi:hypothetical protein
MAGVSVILGATGRDESASSSVGREASSSEHWRPGRSVIPMLKVGEEPK